jgi:hypothetical protein
MHDRRFPRDFKLTLEGLLPCHVPQAVVGDKPTAVMAGRKWFQVSRIAHLSDAIKSVVRVHVEPESPFSSDYQLPVLVAED